MARTKDGYGIKDLRKMAPKAGPEKNAGYRLKFMGGRMDGQSCWYIRHDDIPRWAGEEYYLTHVAGELVYLYTPAKKSKLKKRRKAPAQVRSDIGNQGLRNPVVDVDRLVESLIDFSKTIYSYKPFYRTLLLDSARALKAYRRYAGILTLPSVSPRNKYRRRKDLLKDTTLDES